MPKYIDADELIGAVDGNSFVTDSVKSYVRCTVRNIPSANVEPVRHGRWKKSYADHEAFGVRPFFRYCSECHEATVHQYNYCPNCGAKMDAESLKEGQK